MTDEPTNSARDELLGDRDGTPPPNAHPEFERIRANNFGEAVAIDHLVHALTGELLQLVDKGVSIAGLGAPDEVALRMVACIESSPFKWPDSGLTTADFSPGDIVLRNFNRLRAGVVESVDEEADVISIRQVSNKDHGYILESRVCRSGWLEKLAEADAWTPPVRLGENVQFVDHDGWDRLGKVVDADGIFVRLEYRLRSGEVREGWYDRFARRPRRSGR